MNKGEAFRDVGEGPVETDEPLGAGDLAQALIELAADCGRGQVRRDARGDGSDNALLSKLSHAFSRSSRSGWPSGVFFSSSWKARVGAVSAQATTTTLINANSP